MRRCSEFQTKPQPIFGSTTIAEFLFKLRLSIYLHISVAKNTENQRVTIQHRGIAKLPTRK